MTTRTPPSPGPVNHDNDSVAYVNGHIYTMDPSSPWAEAFIVSASGNFTAVGSTASISAQATASHLITIDLGQHFVMPGIHDAHVHILMSAMGQTSQVQLSPALTTTAAVEELKQGRCLCKYGHANQDWIVGHTYMIENYDRKIIDEAFPETPVMIRGGAGHNAYLNSAALRRAGYVVDDVGEAREVNGQATLYVRDGEGRLTGEMAENGLSKACTTLPQPGGAHVERVLRHGMAALHRAGVTSCQEASANTAMLKGLRGLETQKALKINVHTHIVYAPDWIGEELEESLHKTLDEAEAYASQHVDTRFVKIILDGVPLPPYYTHAGFLEDGRVDQSKLFILNVHDVVQKYDARGMTMKIHCTGHGSTRVTLDAFEAARKLNPNGPRHEVAHCSGVQDADYTRYKALNVTAEMSPAFFFKHEITAASGGLMDWNFKKMGAAHAHTTIGSDWGAGPEPDLLPHMAAILADVGEGDEKLGAERVCRMLTLSGAEAVGKEAVVGSIEAGKRANFIKVDRNLAGGEFEGAKVLATWFEGELVFERQQEN